MNSFQHNCFILREIPLQNKLDAGMDTASTQFHDRLAALEQENIILRLRLQSCECSDAVLQAEVARYKQHKQARQKLASQEAITDPVSIRCSFLEHHWLETTAEVARVLLTPALRCSSQYCPANHWRSVRHQSQLEATQQMITNTASESAQKHLTHAGLLARQRLQEARHSVWSLRSEALESRDLHLALLQIDRK